MDAADEQAANGKTAMDAADEKAAVDAADEKAAVDAANEKAAVDAANEKAADAHSTGPLHTAPADRRRRLGLLNRGD